MDDNGHFTHTDVVSASDKVVTLEFFKCKLQMPQRFDCDKMVYGMIRICCIIKL